MSSDPPTENVPPPPFCVGCSFIKKKCLLNNCPFYKNFVHQGPLFHRVKTVFNLDQVSDMLSLINHSPPEEVETKRITYLDALKFNADARYDHKYGGSQAAIKIAEVEHERKLAQKRAELTRLKRVLALCREELLQYKETYEDLQRGGLSPIPEEDPKDSADEFLGI